jgi:hypothetical protein
MLRRLLSHLTYANVMATIAVFLVLGGGTALAAYVVSSNSQIGPNTVSGHAGSAANKNIIGGSVNSTDLASGAVTGAKIAPSAVTGTKIAGNAVTGAKVLDESLTGADVNEASLNGTARTLYWNAYWGTTDTIATVGPFTLQAECRVGPSNSVLFALHANAGPNGGRANGSFSTWAHDDYTTESHFPVGIGMSGNTNYQLLDSSDAASGSFRRVDGAIMLDSGAGNVIRVDFDAVADARSSPPESCSLSGTATKAT